MATPIITLTTDFGTRDGYAGTVKGVILGICRAARIVDITHEVPPQDIAHAAFVLGTVVPYFPQDAIHLAVVDPGVGTARRGLVLATPLGTFVAPDNGLLTYVVDKLAGEQPERRQEKPFAPLMSPAPPGCRAYVLDRPEFWLPSVSTTFHARDVFGPVAAHLADGVAPEPLGSPTNELVCLALPRPKRRGRVIEGEVIYVDAFGNLVTSIPAAWLGGRAATVELCGQTIRGLSGTYGAGDGLVALIGSHDYLEIAWRDSNAAARLGAMRGTPLRVTFALK
jgi:S-adenosylmethionine hydrolase